MFFLLYNCNVMFRFTWLGWFSFLSFLFCIFATFFLFFRLFFSFQPIFSSDMWIIWFKIFFIYLFLTLLWRRYWLFIIWFWLWLLFSTWLFFEILKIGFIFRHYFSFEFLSQNIKTFWIFQVFLSLSINVSDLIINNF